MDINLYKQLLVWENRDWHQKKLIAEYQSACPVFPLNIPGLAKAKQKEKLKEVYWQKLNCLYRLFNNYAMLLIEPVCMQVKRLAMSTVSIENLYREKDSFIVGEVEALCIHSYK